MVVVVAVVVVVFLLCLVLTQPVFGVRDAANTLFNLVLDICLKRRRSAHARGCVSPSRSLSRSLSGVRVVMRVEAVCSRLLTWMVSPPRRASSELVRTRHDHLGFLRRIANIEADRKRAYCGVRPYVWWCST